MESKVTVYLIEREGNGCSISKHRLAVDTHLEGGWFTHEDLGSEEDLGVSLVVGGVPGGVFFFSPILDGDALQDELLNDPHLCLQR